MSTARRFLGAEQGASLVEYALLIALIALVAFLAVQALGTQVSAVFADPQLLSALGT